MTTQFKKNRKKRGHVSVEHGRIGKHQKHLGQRGNVGYFHRLRNKFYYPILTLISFGLLHHKRLNIRVHLRMILGKGILPPSQPVVVKVKLVSKNVEKKIKAGGAVVVLTA